jgi:hypothetical protein
MTSKLSSILAFALSLCLALPMLGGASIVAADGTLSGANESQHSENHVLLHNYNETDTVATCGAAGPVVAGLAIAATGVSTVTAANDIVEITTGVSPLKEGVVALGGNEDIDMHLAAQIGVADIANLGGGTQRDGSLVFTAVAPYTVP